MKTVSKNVTLAITKKEAEYLSSLIEAQVSRLMILTKRDLAKKPYKDEYKIFNKLGAMLSA